MRASATAKTARLTTNGRMQEKFDDRRLLAVLLMEYIERVWGQSKRYCRAHTNFALVKLREILNPAFNSVTVDLMKKYFRKAREYE